MIDDVNTRSELVQHDQSIFNVKTEKEKHSHILSIVI